MEVVKDEVHVKRDKWIYIKYEDEQILDQATMSVIFINSSIVIVKAPKSNGNQRLTPINN